MGKINYKGKSKMKITKRSRPESKYTVHFLFALGFVPRMISWDSCRETICKTVVVVKRNYSCSFRLAVRYGQTKFLKPEKSSYWPEALFRAYRYETCWQPTNSEVSEKSRSIFVRWKYRYNMYVWHWISKKVMETIQIQNYAKLFFPTTF